MIFSISTATTAVIPRTQGLLLLSHFGKNYSRRISTYNSQQTVFKNIPAVASSRSLFNRTTNQNHRIIVPAISKHSKSYIKMPSLPENFEDTIDPIQLQLLAEECILVDGQDKVIGHDSKKNCHLVQPNGDIFLHRAFSVFLFNTNGELLLQKRSRVKVTFPSMYTNTCCSHPLYRNDEMNENETLGVKIAAQRRLYEELGIPKEDLPLDAFQYLTRIHYKASSNSIWGEHEIDYIFVVKRDVTIRPNPNEIDDVRYVTLEQLNELKKNEDVQLTPWFKLILESGKLPLWWKNLKDLKPFEDHATIHKM